VARALEARFVDLDRVIAARAGKSIAEIFAEDGEAEFRRLEREAMERELDGMPAVIAAGGGWAAQPGNLALARQKAVAIYLEIDPEEVARRIELAGRISERPLLGGRELSGALRDLLAAREPWYRLCEARVDASARPQQVALAVVNLARSVGGW
jgi:shikimate kinase